MKLIILPGSRNFNKVWLKYVKDALSESFEQVISIEYEHWKEEKENTINLDFELKKLLDLIGQDDLSDYLIVAKTAGVALTLKGIYEKKLNPKKCIFVEVPIIWARLNNFKIDDWFEQYDISTIFFQKKRDPSMFHDELRDYLNKKNIPDYEIVEILGTDMEHTEIEEIKKIIPHILTLNSND